ncbi:pentatricopeptide repeat-containing protein [Pyrus ussuriensis x Pyrus communis]|uniref:Pentatricopeptide repeat-containing protein n=1 Tax=Pyrus ussuriensis x Pyrus communis TaxID=2448454 RepID=A0A5N5GE83_9ROSA|nr:pentatricopeptide repeat-containing protein [Pyrus ussuriensis x Pyrus communis]
MSQSPFLSENLASFLDNCSDAFSLRKLHARIFPHGLGNNIFLGCKLLNCNAKFDLLSDSRWLFDRIVNGNLSLWNAILVGYFRAGQFDEVLWRYVDLRRWNIGLDRGAITFGLKSCIELGDLGFGRGIHWGALKSGFSSNGFVGSSLIGLHTRCGFIDDASKVFDERVICCFLSLQLPTLLLLFCIAAVNFDGARLVSGSVEILCICCFHVVASVAQYYRVSFALIHCCAMSRSSLSFTATTGHVPRQQTLFWKFSFAGKENRALVEKKTKEKKRKFCYGRQSTLSTYISQSPGDSIGKALQNRGDPSQSRVEMKDHESLDSRGKKPRRKLFNLELRAEECLSDEEEPDGGLGLGTDKSGCNNNASSSDLHLVRSNGLTDLNEPIQMDKVSASTSVVMSGSHLSSKEEIEGQVLSANAYKGVWPFAKKFPENPQARKDGGVHDLHSKNEFQKEWTTNALKAESEGSHHLNIDSLQNLSKQFVNRADLRNGRSQGLIPESSSLVHGHDAENGYSARIAFDKSDMVQDPVSCSCREQLIADCLVLDKGLSNENSGSRHQIDLNRCLTEEETQRIAAEDGNCDRFGGTGSS